MLVTMLVAAASFGLLAAEPGSAVKKAGNRPQFVDLGQLFARAYRNVIDGNKHDLEVNRKLASDYRTQATALTARRGSLQRARELYRLASIYDTLAASNQAILGSLAKGQVDAPLRQAMTDIMALEKEVEQLTGRIPERDWLTLQEVTQFEKDGGTYRTREPGVLPFLRNEWHVKGKSSSRSRQ